MHLAALEMLVYQYLTTYLLGSRDKRYRAGEVPDVAAAAARACRKRLF